MELNREQIVIEIQSIIKALKVNKGWWENRGRGGWFNHDILEDALALITSQEQRIKELEAENKQYDFEQRKLVEAHDTYKEYAEKMQLFVEKIKHKEEEGYEPSAARYAAEMDMWRMIALREKQLKDEIEKLQIIIFKKEDTMQTIAREKQSYYDELQIIKADTVQKFAERLKKYYRSFEGKTSTTLAAYHIDQIAKEMLE